jgi:hypothetical protein
VELPEERNLDAVAFDWHIGVLPAYDPALMQAPVMPMTMPMTPQPLPLHPERSAPALNIEFRWSF